VLPEANPANRGRLMHCFPSSPTPRRDTPTSCAASILSGLRTL
jgi:hypothetical protein